MCNSAVCVQMKLCKVEHCRASRMCNGAAQYPIRAPASFALRYTMCMCIAMVQCEVYHVQCITIPDPGSSVAESSFAIYHVHCNGAAAALHCSTIPDPGSSVPESSCTKCNSTHSIIRACKLAASKLKSIGFCQRSKMPASPKLLNKAQHLSLLNQGLPVQWRRCDWQDFIQAKTAPRVLTKLT